MLPHLIQKIVTIGIAHDEFQPNVDGSALAAIIIAMVEGALMQSKLYRDPIHMERAVEHLTDYVNSRVIR